MLLAHHSNALLLVRIQESVQSESLSHFLRPESPRLVLLVSQYHQGLPHWGPVWPRSVCQVTQCPPQIWCHETALRVYWRTWYYEYILWCSSFRSNFVLVLLAFSVVGCCETPPIQTTMGRNKVSEVSLNARTWCPYYRGVLLISGVPLERGSTVFKGNVAVYIRAKFRNC